MTAYCKFCEQFVERLIRCHIYPRALARLAAGSGPLLALRDVDGQVQVGRADNGIYDQDIVCGPCENLFARADDYAQKFRRTALSLDASISFPHKVLAFPSFAADASLLHEFAVTTLARACLSSRAEFAAVNEDSLVSDARKSVLDLEASIDSGREVAIVVTRGDLGEVAMSPMLRTVEGQMFFEVRMPSISFFVASCASSLLPAFSQIALKKRERVVVWRRRRPLPVELSGVALRFDAVGSRIDRIMR